MSVVQRTTPSTDPAAVIVSNIMRTFAGTFSVNAHAIFMFTERFAKMTGPSYSNYQQF